MRRKLSESNVMTEQKVGRTDPPLFMFAPLRTQVLDTLETATGLPDKVLSIVAPVGYGKTVLMSILFSDLCRMGKQCLWFGLDDRDTTVEGLVSELGALLNNCEFEQHPTQALFRGTEPVADRIDSLIELINRHPLPITFFIDNLNCCSDEALGLLLDNLLFATKPSFQLVLSSNRELPLNTSRACLEGMISQVGHAELSFGLQEVGGLLGTDVCKRIGTQGVEEVARHTEGWPGAVRMAQIILSNASQPLAALASFSGSDEGLAHLLNRQVLSGFPPEVRDFLLCIAQLRTFCPDLCAEATGSDDAQAHLAYLLERNVFVIPLDRNRSWYRLHGLFREYLLSEAERSLPAKRRQEVMRRAALWCEKHHYLRESIDYALASGLAETACRILEHAAPGFVRDQGDLLQYIKWIETLHEQGHQAGPEAEYWFVWAIAFRRRYEYARQLSASLVQRIEGIQGNLKKNEDPKKKAALLRRIAILRISIDSLTDRIEDAHRGAEQWLAGTSDGTDDSFNVAAAHCIESYFFTNTFRFVDARRAIQSARESAFQTNSAYVDGWVSAYSALIPLGEGDYASAYSELAAALASARRSLGDTTGICGTLALIGAKCAAEMGLDADARQLLELGMQSSETHGFLKAASCGLDAVVMLWSGAGDDPLSPALLRNIASCYPPRLSLMLSCFLVRRLIRLGRKEEAAAEGTRIGLAADTQGLSNEAAQADKVAPLQELLEATRIDLMIASGRFPQAESLIVEESRKAKASGRMARLVELELAMCEVAVRSDRLQFAIRHLTRAIGMAAPRRIVRPFRDQAESIVVLLGDKKSASCAFALDEERRFFNEICQQLPLNDPSLQERLSSQHGKPRLLGTPTPRELELLGLIDAGLSNQQLADRLNVSLTTIKWHLQNLYGKLGISSRSAALARARALSLLPH